MLHAAVQEERQRAKERSEGEVESSCSVNEDMPVEKILEAELAVEPKTETYIETSLGLPSSSVSQRGCRLGGLSSGWLERDREKRERERDREKRERETERRERERQRERERERGRERGREGERGRGRGGGGEGGEGGRGRETERESQREREGGHHDGTNATRVPFRLLLL